MNNYNIAFIGGDKRQVYMANIMSSKGIPVFCFGVPQEDLDSSVVQTDTMEEAIAKSQYVVVPVPMSKDQRYLTTMELCYKMDLDKLWNCLQPNHCLLGGCLTKDTKQYCSEQGIWYYDFMDDSQIAMKNAIATAEGTIAEAIMHSGGNLHRSRGLILGYGRCGKVLAEKLKALDVWVTIAARKPEVLTEAYALGFCTLELKNLQEFIGEFNYVFNTIPELILTKDILEQSVSDVTIIDIASSPGGVDYAAARELERNARLCLGIPGRVAPKASAEILTETLISIIKERSD